MEKEKKNIFKKLWFWLLMAFMIFIFIPAFIEGIKEGLNNETVLSDYSINENKNIVESSETKNSEEEIVFLKGTNGKEFYDILCEVAGIDKKEPQAMGQTLIYDSSNMKYSVELESNKDTQEVAYIRMMAFQEEYENFFLAISRLEYDGSDKGKIYNWVHENLGQDASIEIGCVKFVLTQGTNSKQILEMKTNGYDKYSKEQINKLFN